MARAVEDVVLVEDQRPIGGDLVFEPTQRRVRVMFGGTTIADSRGVMLMIEKKRLAAYYFPASDVRLDLLQPTEFTSHHPGKGEAHFYSLKVGDRVAEKAAWRYPNAERAGLEDYVAFYWDKMDAWFEEDDEVFVHPRDPYHRVDVLNSSRHIQVVVGGEVVAETTRPRILLETGLPPRYYIPKLDVRLDLLTPTSTTTRCPYKGKASYWSLTVNGKEYKDIVWGYPAPIPECPKIENLLCFYDEKVDAVYVDGELQKRPVTPWS
ncbi:MAG TPA: DUF427 domain-containing protein [Candidatus Dormibacteraeota bacterium]|nr:DUF427 domain-containing protein [Candidatus Dormibacteraeota bacterium]